MGRSSLGIIIATLVAGLPSSAVAQTAFLKITSQPSGAAVSVDGSDYGSTPTTVEVSAGTHTVELSLDGYVTLSRTVAVGADLVKKLDYTLAPSGGGTIRTRGRESDESRVQEGTVTVVTRPAGAEVWLDSQKADENSPCTFDITEGTYTLTAKIPGFLRGDAVVSKRVVVRPNRTNKFAINLNREIRQMDRPWSKQEMQEQEARRAEEVRRAEEKRRRDEPERQRRIAEERAKRERFEKWLSCCIGVLARDYPEEYRVEDRGSICTGTLGGTRYYHTPFEFYLNDCKKPE